MALTHVIARVGLAVELALGTIVSLAAIPETAVIVARRTIIVAALPLEP
jgi:hypothetical protein